LKKKRCNEKRKKTFSGKKRGDIQREKKSSSFLHISTDTIGLKRKWRYRLIEQERNSKKGN